MINCDLLKWKKSEWDFQTDYACCDVQYYMISKGYVLDYDNKWVLKSKIKEEDIQLRDVDYIHMHNSDACLINLKQYHPETYEKVMEHRKIQEQEGLNQVQKKINTYLFSLQDSGVCNMFEASSYVITKFPYLTKKECRKAVAYWMKNYSALKNEV